MQLVLVRFQQPKRGSRSWLGDSRKCRDYCRADHHHLCGVSRRVFSYKQSAVVLRGSVVGPADTCWTVNSIPTVFALFASTQMWWCDLLKFNEFVVLTEMLRHDWISKGSQFFYETVSTLTSIIKLLHFAEAPNRPSDIYTPAVTIFSIQSQIFLPACSTNMEARRSLTLNQTVLLVCDRCEYELVRLNRQFS